MKEIILINVRLSEKTLELAALCAGADSVEPMGVLHVPLALERDARAIWNSAYRPQATSPSDVNARHGLGHFRAFTIDASLLENSWKITFGAQ